MKHQTPSRAARKAHKAANRRRNNWMPGFASFTAHQNAIFKRNRAPRER